MATTLVMVLRAASLLAFVGPASITVTERERVPRPRTSQLPRRRAPVMANLTAFVLFLLSLCARPGAFGDSAALLLAFAGFSLAAAGAAFVLKARIELGRAWSLVPDADRATGLVTSGPYRHVRHPIYLGLSVHTLGQALAFASWPALVVLFAGIVPTLMWRAAAEETVLTAMFGEIYAHYRSQTRMIVPYVF
jgi:protein-S-isoprenylcysteine O-methyltransferase Ste14